MKGPAMLDAAYRGLAPSVLWGLHPTAPAGQRGQSISEFALIAPLLLFMVALIFTGSQYLNAVVGMNGAARAGAIVASNSRNANPGMTQSAVTDVATLAVNREQGCNCYVAVASQAACPTGSNCVWTEVLQAPSTREIEMVHVMYTVPSYFTFIGNFVVAAQAGAES
jgi:Flp pilus assembly protein TadG